MSVTSQRGPLPCPLKSLRKNRTAALVSSVLDKYVDDITVLVYGAIEIMLFAANANEHLVHMPGISVPTVFPMQSSCISRTEFSTPSTGRLIGHRDAAFSEEILDIPKAERESVV